jgi:hypothetical protein
MESLQDLAYTVYVQNLSVKKKRRLIEELETDIDNTYVKWAYNMTCFLDSKKLGLGVGGFGFEAHNMYTAHIFPTKEGVVTLEKNMFKEVYYITDNGQIGIIFWDQSGRPESHTLLISDIDKDLSLCEATIEMLHEFVATHPDLK